MLDGCPSRCTSAVNRHFTVGVTKRTNNMDVTPERELLTIGRSHEGKQHEPLLLSVGITSRNHEETQQDGPLLVSRVFAIYQSLLGWKTYKYYYETDELPNPRPTQNQQKQVKSGIWATFSHNKIIFRGLGLDLYRKQTTRHLTQPNSPPTRYSQN